MRTLSLLGLCCLGVVCGATGSPVEMTPSFPLQLESYGDSGVTGLWTVLENRVRQQPLNLVVTLLFLGAITHTFMAQRFLRWAHALERRRAHGFARALHFLGEVEVIFGLWCLPLLVILAARIGWDSAVDYFSNKIRFVEPVFVVVIMALA